MKVEVIEGFEVAGFRVRTKSSNEMDPTKAKIGDLWVRFMNEAGSVLSKEAQVYGIYANYESDVKGEYDVFAAARDLVGSQLSGTQAVTVPAGRYLVFSATGEIPAVCIELWGEIWQYFNSEDCEYERAYTVDFEAYKSCSAGVDIYISIK